MRERQAMSNYWLKRVQQGLTREAIADKAVRRELEKQYTKALDGITAQIEQFYGRYADNNQITLEQAKKRLDTTEFKQLKNQLVELREKAINNNYSSKFISDIDKLSKRATLQRLEGLQVKLNSIAEQLRADNHKVFTDKLSDYYKQEFLYSQRDIELYRNDVIQFTEPNTQAINQAILTKWEGGNYSDRIWQNKARLQSELQQLIPQAFALGRNPKEVARDLRDAMGVDYRRAVRLARTEMNFVANQAIINNYHDQGVDEYQIDAHLDSRTSDICMEMNEQVFRLKDAVVGVTMPPFHPNCRTRTVPYFKDLYEGDMAIFKDMSLEEWQEWREATPV